MAEYGATVWGQAWLRLAEPTSTSGIDTRLPRARALARRGAVLRLQAVPCRVRAEVVVRGREHPVEIRFPTWTAEQRDLIEGYLRAHTGAATALTNGDAPDELAIALTAAGSNSAPRIEEVDVRCPCRETRRPCLHALAVCYALVQRIDEEPALALTMRGYERDGSDRCESDNAWIPLDDIDARGFFDARPVRRGAVRPRASQAG
ncbi:MAG: SWIM zinc finger family protein [Pseudonocardiaceae bacterium]